MSAASKTPLKNLISRKTLAAAITVALTTILGKSPIAGRVSKIEFIPNAAITGSTAIARTFIVKNKGLSGIGTTVLATLTFITSTDAAAYVAKVLTLSAVNGALDVAAGDILVVESADISTGLADPGGRWIVTVTRS